MRVRESRTNKNKLKCTCASAEEIDKTSQRVMRLSIACAATDAEHQNRIILHDNTLNLPVVARQPHPDPNYASFTAARRVAGAERTTHGGS